MADANPATLTRLLKKLDQTLTADEASHLRQSQYDRNRVNANLDYARSLLLNLERNAGSVRVQSQRQPLQADLQQKRAWIKSLNKKLEEYTETAEDESDDDNNDNGDEEQDLDSAARTSALREYAPARQDVNAGLDTGEPQGPRISEDTAAELRQRHPLQASDNRAAASTTAREQLFMHRSQDKTSMNNLPEIQRTEALMSHNRTEQESLVNGLLNLASALKQSSIQFGASLESEKGVLNRAEAGMEQSSEGMQAAEKRMGALRRMSEGQGWWGRLKLYGFIFGLWVACFLLVFIGPKLRF